MKGTVIGAISPAHTFGIPYEPVSHAAQAIYVATNDLLDAARAASTVSAALDLSRTAQLLRERLDAVSSRALDRADELSGGK